MSVLFSIQQMVTENRMTTYTSFPEYAPSYAAVSTRATLESAIPIAVYAHGFSDFFLRYTTPTSNRKAFPGTKGVRLRGNAALKHSQKGAGLRCIIGTIEIADPGAEVAFGKPSDVTVAGSFRQQKGS